MVTSSSNDAFGSGFVPGKVETDKNAVTQAYGWRWSGMPATDSSIDGGSQRLEDFGELHSANTPVSGS